MALPGFGVAADGVGAGPAARPATARGTSLSRSLPRSACSLLLRALREARGPSPRSGLAARCARPSTGAMALPGRGLADSPGWRCRGLGWLRMAWGPARRLGPLPLAGLPCPARCRAPRARSCCARCARRAGRAPGPALRRDALGLRRAPWPCLVEGWRIPRDGVAGVWGGCGWRGGRPAGCSRALIPRVSDAACHAGRRACGGRAGGG